MDDAADATAGIAPYDSWLKDDLAYYSEDCDIPLDVTEYDLDQSVRLFPNPVQDRLHIESSSRPISRVTVYTVLGNTVLDTRAAFSDLQLSGLKPGIYYVRVTLEQSSIVKTLIKN